MWHIRRSWILFSLTASVFVMLLLFNSINVGWIASYINIELFKRSRVVDNENYYDIHDIIRLSDDIDDDGDDGEEKVSTSGVYLPGSHHHVKMSIVDDPLMLSSSDVVVNNVSSSLILFIGVLSPPENVVRRHVIRGTWGKKDRLDSLGFYMKFIIGFAAEDGMRKASETKTLNVAVANEAHEYNDIVFVDELEYPYAKSSQKKAALAAFGTEDIVAPLIMKTDDDVYIKLSVLSERVRQIREQYGNDPLFWGHLTYQVNPTHERFLPLSSPQAAWSHLEAKEFVYIFTRDIATYIARRYRDNIPLPLGDVNIGVWVEQFDADLRKSIETIKPELQNSTPRVQLINDDTVAVNRCYGNFTILFDQDPEMILCMSMKEINGFLPICCSKNEAIQAIRLGRFLEEKKPTILTASMKSSTFSLPVMLNSSMVSAVPFPLIVNLPCKLQARSRIRIEADTRYFSFSIKLISWNTPEDILCVIRYHSWSDNVSINKYKDGKWGYDIKMRSCIVRDVVFALVFEFSEDYVSYWLECKHDKSSSVTLVARIQAPNFHIHPSKIGSIHIDGSGLHIRSLEFNDLPQNCIS